MSELLLERLHKLQDAVCTLGAATDFDSYLQSLVSYAAELTGSETASILEYDPQAKELYFVIVPWFHREILQGVKVPLDASAAGWVVREMKPISMNDVKRDARHFPETDRLSGFQTRSLLAVPLILRGRVFGVIEVLNKTGNEHYTEEDVTILETLATLAAFAMRDIMLGKPGQEFVELDRLKSDFIAITSHELRTPLGLILGHATFLREIVGDQYNEQLDTIIRNATRLKDIIENLSNVDNYESGAARIRQNKISIARVIEDVAASFSGMAKQKQIDLKTNVGTGDLLVEADGSKIAIAISNLVKNAIAFTDQDGNILVKLETEPGYVKVSVQDDGVGIPAKDLPHIFERFFQVESHLTRRHGGMGLGLSVAKSMIEIHGGHIWAESIEGKGSNFIFTLPLGTAQAQSAAKVFID
ncbi:MAG: GAF domain-containing sensor histidine kinase [Anaerolineales bacterium]|nr:GAF domain-containing sensor histidine kinase [Anaerolineales bacterium]